jgi:hypothetical protein
MLVPFSRRTAPLPSATPLDFYRFRHREEKVSIPERRMVILRPLWVVGVSPFDPEIADDAGHVVHLGEPRFTARWSMNPDTIARIAEPDFYDEDLNIIIYEALRGGDNTAPIDAWLMEAACAVAYSKGLIATVDPDELH